MAKFWDVEEVIQVITKNTLEDIVIKKCEKNNKVYVDLRIHKKNDPEDTTSSPTQKGVVIPADQIEVVSDTLYSIAGILQND